MSSAVVLEAIARLPQAAGFTAWFAAHLAEEALQVQWLDAAGSMQLVMDDVGTARILVAGARQLQVQLHAADARMGSLMRLSLVEHLGDYAEERGWPPEAVHLRWQSDAGQAQNAAQNPAQNLVQLKVLRVARNDAITPAMRRLRLEGDVGAWRGNDGWNGLHVRLLLPVPGLPCKPCVWPTLDVDGRLQWAAGAPRLPRRTYTLRHVDVDADADVGADAQTGSLEIDVLLHPSASATAPGADWAAHAAVGSEVGVLSPAGGRIPTAAHWVVVADACAVPAAVRIAQSLALGQSARLLLWVASEAERAMVPPLPPLPQVDVTWLIGGVPGAAGPQLAQVLRWLAAQPWGEGEGAIDQLWAAGGVALSTALRQWLAQGALPAGVRKAVYTYWR